VAIISSVQWKQPLGPVRVNWLSSLTRGLAFVYTRDVLVSRAGLLLAASRYASNAGIQPSPVGLGYRFSGNAADYVRFDPPATTIAGADPCTLEVLVYGSSFPSLGGLAGWDKDSNTTGHFGAGANPGGTGRSIISFNSTDPCNIYWLGAANDADSLVKFQVNTVQHIFAVKTASTGGPIIFYRNGQQIASVLLGNFATAATELSFYLGGGHASRGATLNGVISKAAVYTTALTAAEIAALTSNPWQVFEPIKRAVFFVGAAAGTTHTTTGVLTGPGSTVAGTAAHQHATTGALTGPGAAVAGTAAHLTLHTTTGALTGAGSTVTGTAVHPHTTTGVLTGAGATVTGAAVHPHTTAGALTGAGSAVTGAADHAVPGGVHPTDGVLTGPGSTVAGTAAHLTLHTSAGALTGVGASVNGTATRLALHTTSGILVGPGSTVAGTATHIALHATSGALVGPGAIVVGAASHTLPGFVTHIASGTLTGQGSELSASAWRTQLGGLPNFRRGHTERRPTGVESKRPANRGR